MWARKAVAASVIVAAWLGAGALTAQAARHDTELVSRTDGPRGPNGDQLSFEASISAGGRIVAFYTEASNLTKVFAGGDVIARNRRSQRNTQISVTGGATSDARAGMCDQPALSPDGRHVAFSCLTSPPPGGGPWVTLSAVFVRHRATRRTALVSRASGQQGAIASGTSEFPASSADGRYIAFVSTATNLSGEDTDGGQDVYVRDLRRGVTTLVSRASGHSGAKADAPSGAPSISADGRYVAFSSSARNLSDDDPDATPDVFVRDLRRHTTALASRKTGRRGSKGNGSSTRARISGDGRVVVFTSRADNLSVRDRSARPDVYARDLRRHRTMLVSRASGGRGSRANRGSGIARSTVSGDGRFVAFTSGATNLDPADRRNDTDVFLRDLRMRTTRLVSRRSGPRGRKGNSDSTAPAISASGRFVAFESTSDNLDPADRDTGLDVYVRRVR